MGNYLVTNTNVQKRIEEILDKEGLTIELVIGELKGLVSGEDATEKNKAIRTAAEIMGLIGKRVSLNTQVNITEEKEITEEELKKLTLKERHELLMSYLRKGKD